MNVGIDSIAYDIPKIYLPITSLANQRNIERGELIKGLGLQKMSFPDVHQDVVTFAANACLKLIRQEEITPSEIARIYVGSESGVDSSKPIGSYVLSLLESQLGEKSLRNCDVVDLTFACIGAVDALQNCLDYIRLNPTKKAIVIAADNAKYDLNSSGEYTQGAGSIALLITSNPRILSFSQEVGVSTEGVFDFFKPRRYFSKNEITNATNNPEWMNVLEDEVAIYKEQPVFDGQYSNQCYQDRIREAYHHYKEITGKNKPYENWKYLIFHLPYAFHGKRVFTEIYSLENGLSYETPEEQKAIAKSENYIQFINDKIEKSQRASSEIGNMYTASIFMALLSALQTAFNENEELKGSEIGFLGYGSGSKSKVFVGKVSENWKNVVSKWDLFESLKNRKVIDFETYEKLHRKQLGQSVNQYYKGFGLQSVESENPVLIGARYYQFQD